MKSQQVEQLEVEGAAEDVIGRLVNDVLSQVNGDETDGVTLTAEAEHLQQQVEVEQNFVR